MVARILDLMRLDYPNQQWRFVLHGHEPLTCGYEYLERLLDLLDQPGSPPNFYVRTNGTVLNGKLARLLGKYRVNVGISIDGPEFLHDSIRVFANGRGSLKRIMKNIDLLRDHGIEPTVFCVYTKRSLGHEKSIYDFFSANHLSFQFAPVANVTTADVHGLRLTPSEAAAFHNAIFDAYFFDTERTIRIDRIDKFIARILNSKRESRRKSCFEGALFLDYDGHCYRLCGLRW